MHALWSAHTDSRTRSIWQFTLPVQVRAIQFSRCWCCRPSLSCRCCCWCCCCCCMSLLVYFSSQKSGKLAAQRAATLNSILASHIDRPNLDLDCRVMPANWCQNLFFEQRQSRCRLRSKFTAHCKQNRRAPPPREFLRCRHSMLKLAACRLTKPATAANILAQPVSLTGSIHHSSSSAMGSVTSAHPRCLQFHNVNLWCPVGPTHSPGANKRHEIQPRTGARSRPSFDSRKHRYSSQLGFQIHIILSRRRLRSAIPHCCLC